MENMGFSIIIPAYNEDKTIGKVLKEASKTTAKEIIVVNDGSTDNTFKIVNSFCKRDKRIKHILIKINKGPGFARKVGVLESTQPLLVFFDADIKNVKKEMFEKLIDPIIKNEADLVIADFDNFGRITEFFARPLLRYFFPKLAKLKQPLSGIFAIRRKFIFPEIMGDDYRIMDDILLPAYFKRARITEVYIGEIKHKKRNDDEKTKQAFSECQAFFDFFIKKRFIKTPKKLFKILENIKGDKIENKILKEIII